MLSIRVARRAMNQQVAPFLAIYFVSNLINPNLERMDKLSKNQ